MENVIKVKQDDSVKQTILRLRKTKQEYGECVRTQGIRRGEYWAKHKAGFYELVNLDNYTKFDESPATNDISWMLVAALTDHTIMDRDTVDEFWLKAIGDDVDKLDYPEFVYGFMEGALKLYESVADQV